MIRTLTFVLAAGWAPGPAVSPDSFEDALREISTRYLDPDAVPPALGRGLIEIVSGLDQYSYVLDATQRKRQREAQRAGVTTGVSLGRRGGSLVVVGVVPNSPAARARVEVGDAILAIEGESLFDSAAEANLALYGALGERRRLDLRDESGSLRSVELQLVARKRVSVVESRIIRGGGKKVGVVCIHAFWEGTGRAVIAALGRLRADGAEAVVLDVRANPGGALDEALLVLDELIPEGLLMRTRGREGRVLREERAHARGTDTTTRVVVLVDRNTASAAELLALCLAAHGRATVIGETTFGKGSVQELFGLADGSVLHLTIARYFGPHDRTPDGRGVRPDRVLDETQMSRALERAVQLAGEK